MHNKNKRVLPAAIVLVIAVGLSACSKQVTAESGASAVTGGGVTAVPSEAKANYDGAEKPVDAYEINGKTYISTDDVAGLFKTEIAVDHAAGTISIGDDTRANAAYYLPDISAYPSLEDTIDLPPYEVWTDGGVVDFKYITKNVPFEDMMKKIDEKLLSDGFAPATKEQYASLTKTHDEFMAGNVENTYVKQKDQNERFTPYAIQIIDGGVDKNNLPIVIVRMGS